MNFTKLLLFGLFIMSWNLVLAQETISVVPDKDNTLYQDSEGELSNGAGEYLFAGETGRAGFRRALLYFDVSNSVPENATIDSVRLALSVSNAQGNNIPFTVHEVTTNWGEGDSDAGSPGGQGTTAASGDATWIHAFYPNESWSNAGGDFNTEALSTASISGTGQYNWENTSAMTDIVQHWLDTPDENFGFLIKGPENGSRDAKRFQSREFSNESERPMLTIFYTEMATSNEVLTELPESVELHQNYPNPFNPTTEISYELPAVGQVQLAVYNMLGRKVAEMVNGYNVAGRHTVSFNASALSSGVYIYTLKTEQTFQSRKFTLIK